jgi:6-phosphogluconolactonase (cycloisomerase 2 family)
VAQAVYPGGIKTWTDKTDHIDDIHANLLNEAYAEIIAMETDLMKQKAEKGKVHTVEMESTNDDLVVMTGGNFELTDGNWLMIKTISAANTGPVSILIDSNNAKSVRYIDGSELGAGDLEHGIYKIVYDADNDFFVLAPSGRGVKINNQLVVRGTYNEIIEKGDPVYLLTAKTKLANPATLPAGACYGTSISPDGVYLAAVHTGSPYITIYKRNGDVFAKLPDPAVLPAGDGKGVAFSPDGVYLAVAHKKSPYMTIYKRNGDAFVKLSTPAVLPAGEAARMQFSPDGNYLAVSSSSIPLLIIYKRDGDTFTKLPDQAFMPAYIPTYINFSNDNKYLAAGEYIYERNGDAFTKIIDLKDVDTGNVYACGFSPDGLYFIKTYENSPHMAMYKRHGGSLAQLANPSPMPGAYASSIAFSNDSSLLVLSSYFSTYLDIYKIANNVHKTTFIEDLMYLGCNGAGYAEESGGIGDSKKVALIYR